MRRVSHAWQAIGTTNSVVVTQAHTIVAAGNLARDHVRRLDEAASRFRPDSELSRLNALAAQDSVETRVSQLLGDAVAASLHAAELTGGIVTPTVGRALVSNGYDADISRVQARPSTTPLVSDRFRPAPDWRSIGYEPATRTIRLPQGTALDLGATAKAHTADAVARRLAASLPGGFLVNLGGDIAVAGDEPEDGWPVAVEDHAGATLQVVAGHRNGFATSSTRRRTWTLGGRHHHHIIDPRTGRPSDVVWSQVTCAAMTALVANAASTAAIVLGGEAPRWLTRMGIPARLDPLWGPEVTTPGWPTAERIAA